MKRKAINASLRKESETFDGWLKYEVTIQNEDGSIEVVPAYGKDLQDALSRVVHDERVYKIEQKTKRIPDIIWSMLWFGYVIGLVESIYLLSPNKDLNGVFFVSGIVFLTGVILLLKRWFRQRNISK